MNYKKILKVSLGCFLILCSVITLLQTITWQLDKKDYNKEYVYSNLGVLTYEANGEKIYIEKIYNTAGETLQLNVPDKKTIIMYCDKDKPTEGIYLGMNNTPDSRVQNPVINIYASAFILVVALFILSKKNNKNLIQQLYLFFVFFFIVGLGWSIYEIYTITNYYVIRNDNNMVNATIYSDIYETGISSEQYKAVYHYYVDNNKYTYVDETYKYGNISDVLNTTQELYYNVDNPAKVVSRISPLNFFLLIIGVFITVGTFPFVFKKVK